MNTDSVPISITPVAVICPPRHSTSASASEEAKVIAEPNIARQRAAVVAVLRICEVRAVNSFSICPSAFMVFTVSAPVIASLKSPVICELISRTRRFSGRTFFWNSTMVSANSGITASTRSAKRQLIDSMTAAAPMM